MTFYTDLRDVTVTPLLTQFGQAVTLHRTTPGTYVPANGARGASTSTSYSCYGVVQDYKEYGIDGVLIKKGDKKILLSATGLSIIPQVGDRIALADGMWVIPDAPGAVDILAPSGVPIMFTCHIRK